MPPLLLSDEPLSSVDGVVAVLDSLSSTEVPLDDDDEEPSLLSVLGVVVAVVVGGEVPLDSELLLESDTAGVASSPHANRTNADARTHREERKLCMTPHRRRGTATSLRTYP